MKSIAPLVCWSARLLGLAMFLFVGAFVVGEGPPPITAKFAAFFVAWIGLIVLWRWKLVGGLMVVLGMATFLLATTTIPNFWFSVWMVPGCLSIVGWLIEIRLARTRPSGELKVRPSG